MINPEMDILASSVSGLVIGSAAELATDQVTDQVTDPDVEAPHRAHYMPVLRARASEWDALTAVRPADRARLLPLIEFPPDILEYAGDSERARRAPPTPREHAQGKLAEFAARVATASRGGRVIIDLAHLEVAGFAPTGIAVWSALRAEWHAGSPIVPAVRLSWPAPIRGEAARLVSYLGAGMCLRMSLADLRRTALAADIRGLLVAHRLAPESVDLVVDLANKPQAIGYDALGRLVPDLDRWRTYTVVAGCFPPNLMGDNPELHLNPHGRDEWVVWFDQITGASRSDAAPRLPAFGDFTTQCGCFTPAPRVAGSLSLRYTTDTQILVYRGRRANRAKGYTGEQFIGHARTLCTSSHFFGPGFSAGDDAILAKTQPGVAGPGNPQYWRGASINHHIATTLAQVAAPDGTSTRARAVAVSQAPSAAPAPPAAAGSRRSARTARRAASTAPPPPRRGLRGN